LGYFCCIQTVFPLNWLTAQPAHEVTAAGEGGQIVFLNLTIP
jgi:hypothetical protein